MCSSDLFSLKAVDFTPPPERKAMFGHGCWEDAIGGIERMLGERDYITGRFSAADLYVASELGFMLMFGLLEQRPMFAAYVTRCTDREAYRRAKQLDEQAAQELKAQA